MSETFIVQVMPVWARMQVVTALSGLPHNVIRKLFNEHKVRAVKSVPDKPNSAVVFNVNDVLEWMSGPEAKSPPPFKLGEVDNG